MDKIKILGCSYEVQETNQVCRDEFKFGEIDHVEQTIKISSGLKDDRKAATLLHEIVHGILFSLGEGELHDNEDFVTGFSASLAQVLQDNPDFTSIFVPQA